MNIPALLIGLGAALLLLLAGYLAGLRRGLSERARLRAVTEQQAAILQHWKHRNALDDDGTLKSTIEQVLAPLVERERLSVDLARVGSAGQRRDLSPLLEQVARVGNFGSILLSNEDGLVVAFGRESAGLRRHRRSHRPPDRRGRPIRCSARWRLGHRGARRCRTRPRCAACSRRKARQWRLPRRRTTRA